MATTPSTILGGKTYTRDYVIDYTSFENDDLMVFAEGAVMKIDNAPIIPGVGIGNIKLGITREQLLDIIGSDFKEQFLESGSVIEIDNAKFWLNEDSRLKQIGVQKDFSGKYKKCIGIGSTLQDVKNYVGDYIEVYDTYELKEETGMCFELEDIDDWDELAAPIEYIHVFRVTKH